jgi:hypothetical protein
VVRVAAASGTVEGWHPLPRPLAGAGDGAGPLPFAALALDVRGRAGGTWEVPALDVRLGGVAVTATFRIGPDGTLTGHGTASDPARGSAPFAIGGSVAAPVLTPR